MSAITMTVEYQGKTHPLARMGWYQVRPDGHESPCDNAWFEHATEAHPERPIQ